MEKPDQSAVDQHASLPLLVIEDDPVSNERLGTILESGGYLVACVNSDTDILRLLTTSKVSGIVCGSINRDGIDAIDFLTSLIQHHPDLSKRVIVLTSRPTDRSDVGSSFIKKPFNTKQFLSAIRRAIGEPPSTERILMVDSDEPIRDIMAAMLGSEGYRCHTVSSGADALKLLKSGKRFDLITSDIMNPGMNGHSFLKEVRRRFPEIPTLVITACRDISGSLVKPFEREDLLLAVRRELEKRGRKLTFKRATK